MKKHQYRAGFSLAGSVLLAGGMLLKDTIEFAPMIGWLGSFVCFLIAGYHAVKADRLRKKSAE